MVQSGQFNMILKKIIASFTDENWLGCYYSKKVKFIEIILIKMSSSI
jgi:hypothetical protein